MTPTTEWTISQRLETAISMWLAEFETSSGPIGVPIYPSVMWSLGGEAWREGDPSAQRFSIPAGYSVGFYRRDPAPRGDGLLLVANSRFGYVVVRPKDDDLASERRLIDYDGADIVVR